GRSLDAAVPAPAGGGAVGVGELTAGRSVAPPDGEQGAVPVELLDAVVARVRDVDVPAAVGRHEEGVVELSVARAVAPPGGEEGAVRVELLDAGDGRVRDVDVPASAVGLREGDVCGPVGRPAGAGWEEEAKSSLLRHRPGGVEG